MVLPKEAGWNNHSSSLAIFIMLSRCIRSSPLSLDNLFHSFIVGLCIYRPSPRFILPLFIKDVGRFEASCQR